MKRNKKANFKWVSSWIGRKMNSGTYVAGRGRRLGVLMTNILDAMSWSVCAILHMQPRTYCVRTKSRMTLWGGFKRTENFQEELKKLEWKYFVRIFLVNKRRWVQVAECRRLHIRSVLLLFVLYRLDSYPNNSTNLYSYLPTYNN